MVFRPRAEICPAGDAPSAGVLVCQRVSFAVGAARAWSEQFRLTRPRRSALVGHRQGFGCFGFAGLAQHAWYVQATGTSASTPIAAGVAALVKSANSGLSPAQIRTIMQQTAQDIGKGGYNALFNFGLVDANAAVHKAIR